MSSRAALDDRPSSGRLPAERLNDSRGPRLRATAPLWTSPGYRVPVLRADLVPRPDLVKRVSAARFAKLVLIVAPPGYGKTTLLTEWATRDPRPFIWIRLGRAQRSLDVAAQLAAGFAHFGWIDSDSELAAEGDPAEAARGVIASLEPTVGSFVVVLDDVHAAPPDVLGSVAQALIDELPPGSQLALGCRAQPPLPVGSLRAHRALVEVDEHDLAMNPVEAAALLRVAGLEPDFAAVRALVTATEGWPVGLYLAALALQAEPELDDFGGDHHLVAEYFRDELLPQLPADELSLLRSCSVLDELSGPLCDAVLSGTGSSALLSDLAQRSLMLSAVDGRHERFRVHPLFRATLRQDLRRLSPETEAGLHRRAGHWLSRHGDRERAVSHAIAAADPALAAELLWADLPRTPRPRCATALRQWVGGLSAHELTPHPTLAVTAAYTALLVGDVAEARRLIAVAGDAELPSTSSASLQAGIGLLEAALAKSVDEMAQRARRAYELEPEQGRWRALSCLMLGVAEHLGGDPKAARDKLEEGVDAAGADAPEVASLCLAQAASVALEQADWDRAGELVDRAMTYAESDARPVTALVFAVAAVARTHVDRLDEAKRDLLRGLQMLGDLGDLVPWYAAQTRIMLARAAVGLSDTVRARELLADASRFARRSPGAVVFSQWLDGAWEQIDTVAETAFAGPASLTIAELRILRFMPSHRSFREIGQLLGVSVNTVKSQAHAVYRKLGASSRSEAVVNATRVGLLGS